MDGVVPVHRRALLPVRACRMVPQRMFRPGGLEHRKPLEEAWALTAQLELNICAMSPPLCSAGVFGKQLTPSGGATVPLSVANYCTASINFRLIPRPCC